MSSFPVWLTGHQRVWLEWLWLAVNQRGNPKVFDLNGCMVCVCVCLRSHGTKFLFELLYWDENFLPSVRWTSLILASASFQFQADIYLLAWYECVCREMWPSVCLNLLYRYEKRSAQLKCWVNFLWTSLSFQVYDYSWKQLICTRLSKYWRF